MWQMLIKATTETIYMVCISGLIAALGGLPLGAILYATRPGRPWARPTLHNVLSVTVNITRSIPFIILMIFLIPVTRLLVGTSIGVSAAIVPLALGALPFYARLAESALNEVSHGLVEAGLAMGATPVQVLTRILFPEALPGLINGLTITLIALVGYSAMAGTIGGGGLGALAINYGYNRFDTPMMLATVVVLIILVQALQMLGDWVVHRLLHKK
jgi:D-methionine transport system permease protein